MYISPTKVKFICAALWIGALSISFLYLPNAKISDDFRKFLDILCLVMAAIGFIVGSRYGLFPSGD